jgi:hypothetical protein
MCRISQGFFCTDLVHRTKAYEIITGVIIVVLLGIIFLICFCLRRQLRGRGANAPKEMEGNVYNIHHVIII